MKVKGTKELYKEALNTSTEKMFIDRSLIMAILERIDELEIAVIDMRASLRTCQNTASFAMDMYKGL